MAGIRAELLRSLAVGILTVQCVLTGTLAALDEAGLAVLEVLEDANRAGSELSSWRMSQTARTEQNIQDPIPISSVCDLKVDQIVSARTGAPGEFDSYARLVDVLNLDAGVQLTFTMEVSNVGVDIDAEDDHWVRFSSVSPAELEDGLGIPQNEWNRVGSVGPDFRDAVLSLVDLNNATDLFTGSGYDPNVVVVAEEREGETLDGVETRVFFTRYMVTQSSLADLMTPISGLDTVGLLEATFEDVTWLDAETLLTLKQESTADTKNEGFTQVLSATTLFFDHNVPVQVPDSTTTLAEATAAIAG